MTEARIAELYSPLQDILSEHPQGVSEFELIAALGERGYDGFDSAVFRDQLNLFQTHFLLFHTLYRLSDALQSTGRGCLEIGCLCIRWLREAVPATLPATDDALRRYYLDISQLSGTTDEDVAELLGRFWARFDAHERRDEALEILGLEADADFAAIKLRYRQLAMTHHPDRGGDKAQLQEINRAMALLARAQRA